MIGTIISHYKILDKLGEGGMGVVYRALDTKLNRTVALKFLPQNVALSEKDRKRFIREAQAASALDHANICSIHEIDESPDGQLFIVMPAYEGMPLNKKIEQGPLPVTEAIEIARLVAAGIQAAHEKGIIHRDIKSSNIFVTHKEQVKIMDFGLARGAGMIQVTKTGMTVGTVPYMSPEQAQGEKVDHRTDIWSLGVVLYEMIAGRLPFRGDYQEAVLYQILNEEPEPLTGLRSQVPMELERVVKKCMEKNPGDRYQHVDELTVDFRIIQKELFAGTSRISSKGRKGRPAKRGIRSTVTALSLLFGLVLLIGLMIWAPWQKREISLEGKGIAVLPFTVHGDDGRIERLADGLTEVLTSNLTPLIHREGRVWVVPSSELREYQITTPSKAFEIYRVDYVITGSLQPIFDRLLLTLNLIDARNLRQLDSKLIDEVETDVRALHNRSVFLLMEMLQLEFKPEDEEFIDRRFTRVTDAFDPYIEARGYLHRYDLDENIDRAIPLLEEAIASDGRFGLAYAGLCEAYWRKFEITREYTWVEDAIQQCGIALDHDAGIAAPLITLGMIHTGTGRYDESIEYLNRALEIDPVNADAYRELANTYESAGMYHEAETTFHRAIRLQPHSWEGYHASGRFYYRRGRYEEAIQQFRRVIELTPDNYRGYSNLGAVYYFLDRTDEAREMFLKSLNLGPNDLAAANLGSILYSEGRFDEAARMYEIALDFNDRNYRVWGNLGSAYYWSGGNREKSSDAYLRAIELAEQAKDVNPQNHRVIINLGEYHAMIENRDDALAYISLALSMAPDDKDVLFRAGATYERLGERGEALHLIERSLAAGYPLSDILPQPILRDLIADEQFQKMIRDLTD